MVMRLMVFVEIAQTSFYTSEMLVRATISKCGGIRCNAICSVSSKLSSDASHAIDAMRGLINQK